MNERNAATRPKSHTLETLRESGRNILETLRRIDRIESRDPGVSLSKEFDKTIYELMAIQSQMFGTMILAAPAQIIRAEALAVLAERLKWRILRDLIRTRKHQ